MNSGRMDTVTILPTGGAICALTGDGSNGSADQGAIVLDADHLSLDEIRPADEIHHELLF